MPNGIRIENSLDILDVSTLAGSKFTRFLYFHFNVPPTRITDLVRNVSDERIYSYGTVNFVYVFAFYQVGLCSSQLYS